MVFPSSVGIVHEDKASPITVHADGLVPPGALVPAGIMLKTNTFFQMYLAIDDCIYIFINQIMPFKLTEEIPKCIDVSIIKEVADSTYYVSS